MADTLGRLKGPASSSYGLMIVWFGHRLTTRTVGQVW
jgi:hypothetical protein